MSSDLERQRRLYRAVLARALDDLDSLLHARPLTDEFNGLSLTGPQRQALLFDTLDYFLNPEPSPCSLDVVCDALGMDADIMREKARQLIHSEIRVKTRRLKLKPDQVKDIRRALAGGQTTRTICERHNVDISTIRKQRIRWRAGVKNAAA